MSHMYTQIDECKSTYLCRNGEFTKRCSSDHHFLLSTRGGLKGKGPGEMEKSITEKRTLMEEQDKALSEVSPEAAQKIRQAFTSIAAKVFCAGKDQPGVVNSSTCELPVILMLLEVTTWVGQKNGTLFDLGSKTNYITHKAARRLDLQGEMLAIHGVGGMTIKVKTHSE